MDLSVLNEFKQIGGVELHHQADPNRLDQFVMLEAEKNLLGFRFEKGPHTLEPNGCYLDTLAHALLLLLQKDGSPEASDCVRHAGAIINILVPARKAVEKKLRDEKELQKRKR